MICGFHNYIIILPITLVINFDNKLNCLNITQKNIITFLP